MTRTGIRAAGADVARCICAGGAARRKTVSGKINNQIAIVAAEQGPV